MNPFCFALLIIIALLHDHVAHTLVNLGIQLRIHFILLHGVFKYQRLITFLRGSVPDGCDLILLAWLPAFNHVVVIFVFLIYELRKLLISMDRSTLHSLVINPFHTLFHLFLPKQMGEWASLSHLVVLQFEHLPLTHVVGADVQLLMLILRVDLLDATRLGSDLSAANPVLVTHIVGAVSVRAKWFDP